MALASLSLRAPGDLGIRAGRCGDRLCVGWVMPASHAWHEDVRPGMGLVSLNGHDPLTSDIGHPWVEAVILFPDGTSRAVRVVTDAFAEPWAQRSLVLVGALFALLGALVLARRPDAQVARLFGVFTTAMAFALAAAPAAGGPHPPWSLALVFVCLMGAAASLPAFAAAFCGFPQRPGRGLRIFRAAGGIIMIAYVTSVIVDPPLYETVRPAFALYISAGLLAALAFLARQALVREASGARRDARIALGGIACGFLPFVGLTLVPQLALQLDPLAPSHVTALMWGVIPLTFAYAILRHQVLGIRRLVHRGMVYGITTAVLVAVLVVLVLLVGPFVGRSGAPHPAVVTAGLLALGVFLFQVLSRAVRRLVDRFYPDEMDSGTLLAAMRCDLLESGHAGEVVAAIVRRLRESLHLESVVLFLGTTEDTMRAAASTGPMAEESAVFIRPRILDRLGAGPAVDRVRWKAEELLVARLEAAGETLGFLVLGPKEKGDIFVREELRLVETISPILALAIRETRLVTELREVSERLTRAEEAERGRLARDLHDGPLQKAILLGGVAESSLRDRQAVARELVADLRELCARLRPAILDDLGLVPALEWLLEQTAQGFAVTPRLTLRGLSDDDRLDPGAELALFRVTQEAVSNALKHGHATSIHVSLTRTLHAVELSVTDDGSGSAENVERARGLGIPGMRERLRQVGGSVSIAPAGRMGTKVYARIPFAAAAGRPLHPATS